MKRRNCTAMPRAPRPRKVEVAVTPLREYTPAEVAAMTPEQLEVCQEAAAQEYIQMLRHGAIDPDLAEKGFEARRPRGKR